MDLSNQTVRNRWREKGFRCRQAATKPLITERNRKRRSKWVKDHISWTVDDWENVLFSDESPFVARFE